MNAFIYLYLDPKDMTPRYVGIGGEGRAFRHLDGSSNAGLDEMIKTRISEGFTVRPVVLPLSSMEDAKTVETFWIRMYGRVDLATGTLFNLTDGGDGMKNPSPYIIARIRGANKSESHRAALSRAKLGKPHSEAHKQALSDAHKARGATLLTCPHCQKSGGEPGMKTWHFDRCRSKELQNG